MTEVLAPSWLDIAKQLGVPRDVILAMKEMKDYTDYQRMKDIWNIWFLHITDLTNKKKYPHTFVGLDKLLKDSGNGQQAKTFFSYIKQNS